MGLGPTMLVGWLVCLSSLAFTAFTGSFCVTAPTQILELAFLSLPLPINMQLWWPYIYSGLILERAREPNALCLAPMKSLPTLHTSLDTPPKEN